MKKAFDQNVSRAKPRVKLGSPDLEAEAGPPAATTEDEAWVYEVAAQVAGQGPVADAPPGPLPTARELMSAASKPQAPTPAAEPTSRARVEATLRGAADAPRAASRPAPPAQSAPAPLKARAPVASPPTARSTTAVRSEPPRAPASRDARPAPLSSDDIGARREKLRERLRNVREHPRPEPLPTNVAAAGVLVVERISQLQTELAALKAHNAALQHDLDVARRTAERATEEARARVEEARRLAAQMEERSGLLAELERELQSVEGERDEALLAVQEARTRAAAERDQREQLGTALGKKDAALAESLVEEERLATELETFRDESLLLRRSVEALSAERDTLARQVSDLTAERAELLEARKALESVHRALTEAVARR